MEVVRPVHRLFVGAWPLRPPRTNAQRVHLPQTWRAQHRTSVSFATFASRRKSSSVVSSWSRCRMHSWASRTSIVPEIQSASVRLVLNDPVETPVQFRRKRRQRRWRGHDCGHQLHRQFPVPRRHPTSLLKRRRYRRQWCLRHDPRDRHLQLSLSRNEHVVRPRAAGVRTRSDRRRVRLRLERLLIRGTAEATILRSQPSTSVVLPSTPNRIRNSFTATAPPHSLR
jgi:hypothetical protein